MSKKQAKKSRARAVSATRKTKALDPKAAKNFKSLTMHMNEYEYTRFVQAAESAERGLLDFLRLALKRAIVAELDD